MGHHEIVLFWSDIDLSERIFFKEELQLSPIILPSTLILAIFEGMHGYFTGLVSADDLGDQESIAHIFSVIFDGIGEI